MTEQRQSEYDAAIKGTIAMKMGAFIFPVRTKIPWFELSLSMSDEDALIAEKIFRNGRKKYG